MEHKKKQFEKFQCDATDFEYMSLYKEDDVTLEKEKADIEKKKKQERKIE